MKTNTLVDRMTPKSLNGLLATHFQRQYNLSPRAAETICQDTVLYRNIFTQHSRSEGQIIYYAVKLGEPPSKRIRDCELIPVRLSVNDPKDVEYYKEHGLRNLIRRIIARITKESYEQGAPLSIEDVARILHISARSVKRHKEALRNAGVNVILRGETADMGPGNCHRTPIIELFLQGYSETEVARRLSHTLERVEEYLCDFLRVGLLLKENYHPGIVARITHLSKSKVLKIKTIYERLRTDPFYSEPLKKVLDIFELKRTLRKKGALR